MSQPSIKPAAQRWRNGPFGGKGVNATGGCSHQSKQPCVCVTVFKLHCVLCFCIKTWSCTQQLKVYSTCILVCFFTQLRCRTRAQCSFSAPLLCVYTANYWLGMDTAGLSATNTGTRKNLPRLLYLPLSTASLLTSPRSPSTLPIIVCQWRSQRDWQMHTDRRTDVPSPVPIRGPHIRR